MKANYQSISGLDINPMSSAQQMQIKGGGDIRQPRPGSGTTTVPPTKGK